MSAAIANVSKVRNAVIHLAFSRRHAANGCFEPEAAVLFWKLLTSNWLELASSATGREEMWVARYKVTEMPGTRKLSRHPNDIRMNRPLAFVWTRLFFILGGFSVRRIRSRIGKSAFSVPSAILTFFAPVFNLICSFAGDPGGNSHRNS